MVPKTLLYIPEISSSILPCLLIMFIVSRSSVFRILHCKLCKICKVCKICKHLVYHFKDKDMGICLSSTFQDPCCPSQGRRWSARQMDLRHLQQLAFHLNLLSTSRNSDQLITKSNFFASLLQLGLNSW